MPLDTILLILAAILFFYFLMIRPMRKQVAAQQELRNSLEVGSRVQLSSGIIATIKHLGDRQVIVELAPGVEVTVVKQAIGAIVKAEDEEFEYEDEAGAPEEEQYAGEQFADEQFAADGVQFEGETEATAETLDDQVPADENSTEENKGY